MMPTVVRIETIAAAISGSLEQALAPRPRARRLQPHRPRANLREPREGGRRRLDRSQERLVGRRFRRLLRRRYRAVRAIAS